MGSQSRRPVRSYQTCAGLMPCALPCSQESSEVPTEDQTCRVGFGEGALSQSVLFHVAPVAEASHVVACSGSVPLEEMHG